MREFRIIEKGEWSPIRKGDQITFKVKEVLGTKLGKAEKLQIRIADIFNDKKPDHMINMEGFCLTIREKVMVVVTEDYMNNGFGLINTV